MQLRLGPKHKHKIISHTRLGVGRAGKQSDWRMYWSSREGGAPSQESWSILQANSLNLWWDLCVFVWGSIPSTLYTLWYTCLCVGAYVHACVVCSHINTTNSSVTCQKETNVCVSKRLPGVRERGFSCTTTSEAFIVELKATAIPEPQILLITPSALNRGTVRGFKTSSGSDGKGKSSQI